jgi:hypothetical protein
MATEGDLKPVSEDRWLTGPIRVAGRAGDVGVTVESAPAAG